MFFEMEEDDEQKEIVETERLMTQFPTFMSYLETQYMYDELKDTINRASERQVKERNVETKFTANLSIRKKKAFEVPDYPEHWKAEFENADSLIRHALTFVNEQISSGCRVFPQNKDLFRAFELVKPKEVRLIVIAQDPYHSVDADTGLPVATGMSFECRGKKLQPSLANVFKELKRTHGVCPSTGDLSHWAKQGVLLINTCLTVNEGKAKSHGTIWNPAMIKILQSFFDKKRKVIVALWGAEARKFFEKAAFGYKKANTLIVQKGHPSSLNTTNPFVGCGFFEEVDEIYEESGLEKIDWIGK